MSASNASHDERAEKLAQLRAAVARLEAEVEVEEPAETAAATTAPAAKPPPTRSPKEPADNKPAHPKPAAKTAPANATAAAADEDDEAEDDDDDGDEASPSLTSVLRAAPAWLVSFIAHMILLIILGVWTLANLEDPNQVFVLALPMEEAIEELEEIDFESEPLEEMELETISTEFEVPDPGEMTLGDIASDPTEATPADIGQVSLPNSIDQIGALFDGDGKGMTEFGKGMGGAATFFGSKVKGSRFVFVVDNSNSMSRGRLETAMHELMLSVSKMEKNQRFFVIFFSDAAYPMFHPKPARDMVPATGENKRKLEYWLPKVQMCLRTQGSDAVKMAIAMRPDAIYILGDGAFTDNATDLLTRPHNRKIVINTLGMEVNERGEKQLMAIAKANGGTYRAVAASRAALLSARTRPIPRNRTRGPVWGVNLPAR